jgi:hypothetical protein
LLTARRLWRTWLRRAGLRLLLREGSDDHQKAGTGEKHQSPIFPEPRPGIRFSSTSHFAPDG